jgi:hypothetical protein
MSANFAHACRLNLAGMGDGKTPRDSEITEITEITVSINEHQVIS